MIIICITHPFGGLPFVTLNLLLHHKLLQRVLEHCDDPKTQQIMMDEILQSVCLLAQDQYGNYVVQVSAMFSFERYVYMLFLPSWF
jgi:hypothetical protein